MAGPRIPEQSAIVSLVAGVVRLRRNHVMVAILAFWAAGSIITVSPEQAQAACTIRDGTSRTGVTLPAVPGWPPRYKYPDSRVYVGARYNSCTNKVVIYYGGEFNGPSYGTSWFYQLRRPENGNQVNVPQGLSRIWTISAPAGSSMGIMAQYCQRVTLIPQPPAKCYGWTPIVRVALQ